MQIHSAAVVFTVDYRHLINSCDTAEIMVLHSSVLRLYKMFSEKRCNVCGLKTLIKKAVSTGTIER